MPTHLNRSWRRGLAIAAAASAGYFALRRIQTGRWSW